jgi:hypothetical protein
VLTLILWLVGAWLLLLVVAAFVGAVITIIERYQKR